ncbi:MAG: hypothetical protein U0704_07000 [Candidatus Eisenbacteria bacterium]
MRTSHDRPLLLRLGLLACLAIGTLHTIHYWPEVIDDSYIFFRFARNFVNGHAYAFNAGEPNVEGFSSFTWFWLCVAGLRMGVADLLSFVKWCGLALHLATIVGVFALADGFRRDAKPWALVAPALYALHPFGAYHAVTGLETPLSMAAIVASMLALTRLATHPRAAFAGLALAWVTVAWTRPEGFGYVAGCFVAALVLLERPARGPLLRAAAVAAVALAALFAWRWLNFGAVLPNTVAAKAAGASGHETLRTGLVYVVHFFHPLPIPTEVLASLFTLGVLVRRGNRRDLLLCAPIACAMGFSAIVRGDWMHSFRFMLPAAPFLALLTARALEEFAAPLGAGRGGPLTARIGMAAAALVVALSGLQFAMLDKARDRVDGFGRGWKPANWVLRAPGRLNEEFPPRIAGVTRWSLEHLGRDQKIATADIGFPGWTLNAPLLDVAGLTDPAIARLMPVRDTVGFAERLREQAPAVIVMRTEHGMPVAVCDRLIEGSGVLAGYTYVDSLESYSESSRAVVFRRNGVALDVPPDSVLAHFDDAILHNPKVAALRAWRNEFAARHGRAAR